MLVSLAKVAKGESVLPTLGFILCVYILYALYKGWTRRHRRQTAPYRQYQRRRRLTLVGGTGVGVGLILLICILGLPGQYENLKSASIISTSWGYDACKPGQVMSTQEILPLKTQGAQCQPVYAYLHPETPPSQLQEAKGVTHSQKGKLHRWGKHYSQGKAHKIRLRSTSKKNKAAAKHRPKHLKHKKKQHSRNLASNKH